VPRYQKLRHLTPGRIRHAVIGPVAVRDCVFEGSNEIGYTFLEFNRKERSFMRARISYPGFISNKRTSTMRTRNSSNVRLRFRSADSPLAGTIRYGIGTCTHGAFLVARRDDCICVILMSEKADLLHPELVEVFPSNRLEESSALRLDLVAVASFLERLPVRCAARAYCRRHDLPAACLEATLQDPQWQDSFLFGVCAKHRRGESSARRRGLRCKHIGHRDSLPPGG